MKTLVFASTAAFVFTALVLGIAQLSSKGEGTPAASTTLAPRVTMAEIARHNRRADCWLVIAGRVYNVTAYIDQHPAPASTIVETCGTDATVAFESKGYGRPHSPRARKLLDTFLVAELTR
jgi:cytochrome b involved in lipid metabolism